MTPKDILLHLRLPFSLFLMPVYWFALSQSPNFDTTIAVWVFIIWHILVYPASNAYNSYFDKDEGSIGGLEKPPTVDKKLFYVAWAMDVLAVILGYIFAGMPFAIAVLVYGLVSKSYSHTAVRLKKYPILSWLIVGFFQGFFVYISTQQAVLQDYGHIYNNILPATLSSMMLWAVYPMTQIYQHQEDAQRGDHTMSILLGIKGTFYFTGIVYSLTAIGFYTYLPLKQFFIFVLCTAPTVVFFLNWFLKVWKDETQANFKNTMWLNLLASLGLNILFIALVIINR